MPGHCQMRPERPPQVIEQPRGESEKMYKSSQEEFDSAFDEGHEMDEGLKKPDDKPVKETAKTTDADFDDEIDHGKPTQKTTAQEPTSQDQGGEQYQDDDDVDWKQRFKSYDGRMKVRETQWEQEKSQLRSELEDLKRKSAEQQNRPSASAKEETQDTDNGPEFDEDAFTSEYGDEVLKAVKHYAKQIVTDTVSNSIKPLTEKLPFIERSQAEIQKRDQQEAGRRFYESVKSAHEDFDDYIPGGQRNSDLLEWIDSQKPYLIPGYKAVYESGSVEDTQDLIAQYKQARNISNKSGNRSDPPNQSNFEAVRGRRTPPSRGRAGKDDFDGAWEEAERNERR